MAARAAHAFTDRGASLILGLAIGTVGGLLFSHFHLPLPWMLGAMFATFVASLARVPVRVPDRMRPPMVTVVGTMLGASFTLEMLMLAYTWWLPLLGLATLVAASAVLCALFFRVVAGFDWKTSYFAGMPGGIIEMITMGTAYGADVRRIAVVHSARILLVVFTIPFLIRFLASGGDPVAVAPANAPSVGWDSWLWLLFSCLAGFYGARLLRLPAGELVGPLIVSAALHLSGMTAFTTPAAMVTVAQVVIGSMIGCRFSGMRTAEILTLVAYSAGSVVILVALATGIAFAVAAMSGINVQHLVLAYAPGGLAEMGLVALSMHFDVSLVIVHHIVRVLLVALGAGALFRAFGAKRLSEPAPAGTERLEAKDMQSNE